MHPGRDCGVTAVGGCAAEGCDQGFLEGVSGILGVTGGAERHRPETIAVSREEHAEGGFVALEMGSKERPIVEVP